MRFQRQKPIGDYIVDFYCAKAQLVVEPDGKYHFTGDQVNKDMERSCYLEAAGLTVFRVKNTEIDGKFKETCNKIDYLVKAGIARLESQSES